MALDATVGGVSADSYVTLAEYVAYAALMGWTLTGDAATQEPTLRRARMALDGAYRWYGEKTTNGQKLAWPRDMHQYVDGWTVPDTIIPQPIKDAQCEMAYLMQNGADPFATVAGGAVESKREKVDVIEEETTYAMGSGRDRPAYPVVDQLVADYAAGKVSGRSGSIGLMRA